MIATSCWLFGNPGSFSKVSRDNRTITILVNLTSHASFVKELIRDAVLSRLLPLTTQHLVDSDVETTSPVPINM